MDLGGKTGIGGVGLSEYGAWTHPMVWRCMSKVTCEASELSSALQIRGEHAQLVKVEAIASRF